MRKLFVLVCLLLLPVTVQADTHLDAYYSYQDYLKAYPAQREISANFATQVRNPVEATAPITDKRVKVAVIYPGIQASDYWRRSVSSFEARLRDHKIPYEIRPFFTKPAREIRLQEAQIQDALKLDPDYLVFTLDAVRHEKTIQQLIKKGRPKVIVQNATRPVRQWGEHQPFLYVGFDHAVGSALLAEEFMSRFPKQTPYAMFYGSRGFVSTARGGTFEDIVKERHDSEINVSYYLDFDRERARKATLHLIARNKLPKFVYACSTDIALGVIDGAKEAGVLDQVSINGWGGGGDELDALQQGKLDFTVMRMNDDNGVAMADAIALDLQGRTQEVPQVYSGDMMLVDQTLTIEEILKLRKRAFRYSDKWRSAVGSVLTSE